MTLAAEQLEIQALARDFADGELRPHAAAWDEARALDESIFAKLAELGFLGMRVPESLGGLGFDASTYLLVLEELARGDASVALSVAIHSGPVCGMILRHGTEAQKEAWLPRLASGELVGAFALSEAEAGSDVGAVATLADSDGDGWTLNGAKRWVTNGTRGGLVVIFAGTGEKKLGAFLVEPSAEGYEVRDTERTLGLRASQTVTVALDGVRVGAEALLGEPDAGMGYAMEALDEGRVGIAAQAVGIARAAMEHAVRYALERHQFGQALADFGAIQAKIAEMHRRIMAARALTRGAAEALEAHTRGEQPRTGPDGLTARAAVAKVTASEAATWVADEAIQIFGGYGYMRDYPVEKLLRDAKGTEIYEGTSEIMRHVIAREVLRAARET
ncbi:MAG: acyl-CoA dehydrogenase family protein [Gemmatimonadota bacterium]|jgi:alkylation response protein AidB-like acyl-CoA dehydrogenase